MQKTRNLLYKSTIYCGNNTYLDDSDSIGNVEGFVINSQADEGLFLKKRSDHSIYLKKIK